MKKKIINPALGLLYISICILFLFLVIFRKMDIYGTEDMIAETSTTMLLGYKSIIRDLSMLEPQNYLYGGIYTYILVILGFPVYLLLKITHLWTMKKLSFYILFRVINVFISLIPLVFFYKVAQILNKKKTHTFLAVLPLVFMVSPVFVSRTQFINQDMLALAIFSTFVYAVLKYLDSYDFKWSVILLVLAGVLLSAKQLYILPVSIGLVFYLIKGRKWHNSVMFFIVPISYFISNPFAFVHFDKYVARNLRISGFEAGLSLESNYSYFFYILRILYFLWPALLVLTVLFFKNGRFSELKRKIDILYVYIVVEFLGILVFLSLLNRKLDRWGLPLYFLAYILLFVMASTYVSVKGLWTTIAIQVIWSFIILLPLLNFLISIDPRYELKSYLESHSNSKIIVISDHGNNVGIEGLDNVTMQKHLVYAKDNLEAYYPNTQVMSQFDYLVISNGALRDFSNPNNILRYDSINSWHEYIQQLDDLKVYNIGAEKILYEPMIGFSIYKNDQEMK